MTITEVSKLKELSWLGDSMAFLFQTRLSGAASTVLVRQGLRLGRQAIAATLLGFLFGLLSFGSVNSAAIAATANPPQSSSITQAEAASEQVFEGLETTKMLVGKRASRNQAIEHGREKASEKLSELAKKAKTDPESLNDSERKALEQLEIQ